MAFGDLLDLAQAAVRSAQGDPLDTAGDLARAKDAVNEAYLTVCGDGYPYDFLEVEGQWDLTAGSDTYTYGSIATAIGVTSGTIREIHGLINDTYGGVPLHSTSWQQLESYSASSQEPGEGTGTPTTWAKWGAGSNARIRFYPMPDQVYRIGTYCLVSPGAMSADADVPLIPLPYRHRLLVPYAAALLLEVEGGQEAAADYERRMARHREALRDLRTAHATAKHPTFNLVTDTAFDHHPGSGVNWTPW